MHRVLSKVLINLLAVTFAVPATLACAAPRDEAADSAVRVSQPSMVSPLRVSTERAIATTLAADRVSAQHAGVPAKPQSTRIRAQGGGKSGMVMGLVSTVVGIAGAVYMVKYMKDQQKKTDGQ